MTIDDDAQHRSPRLLIAPSGHVPSATDIRRLVARLGLDTKVWSGVVVAQLLNAAMAAERWLSEYPEKATRLYEDPVGAVAEMRQSGVLTEPVDDLLDALTELHKERPSAHARIALRPTRVEFGAKPELRFASQYESRSGSTPEKRKR